MEAIISSVQKEKKKTVSALHSPQYEKTEKKSFKDVPGFTDELLQCFHCHSKIYCQFFTFSSLHSAV